MMNMHIQENDGSIRGSNVSTTDVIYQVEDSPKWYTCFVLGLQHFVAFFIGALSVPLLISQAICIGDDHVAKAELVGTFLLTCAIATLLQISIGVRLPIVQAGTFALLSPTLAFLNLPQYQCPPLEVVGGNYTNGTILLGSDEHRWLWTSRLSLVQGSIMVASVLEVLLGFSGALGFLLRYIGPLSIAPTISLLGLSLFRSAANYGSKQWWICLMTLAFMALFSQYITFCKVPCPRYDKEKGCFKSGYPLFKMFPVFLAVLSSWLICWIFTVSGVFPDSPSKWGYYARTDIRLEAVIDAPWFRMPYPGQWGTPGVDASLVCGLLAGILASILESVGDYYACAKLAGAPPPPKHAINRGIGIEGIGNIMAGIFGTGNGTTSTSINIGVVGLTRCGSRVVIYYCVGIIFFLSIINKFGGVFIMVPDPVIGGSFFVLFGMIVAVGISNLQYVDMNSGRNLFIFGFSFFFGLAVSEWIKDNPRAIQTGSEIADNVFTVLLSTGMFVGGVTGFILDNTIKGTQHDKGMGDLLESDLDPQSYEENQRKIKDIYGFPLCGNVFVRYKWLHYVPFLPGYGQLAKDIAKSTNNLVTNELQEHSV